MKRARAALALGLLLLACGTKKSGPDAATTSTATSSAPMPEVKTETVVLEPLVHPETCSIGHEGILLDLGIETARPELGLRDDGIVATEREGASWERISTHSLTLRFVGPPDGTEGAPSPDGGRGDLHVDARLRGVTARSVSLYLNGKALGTMSLSRGETTLRSLRSSTIGILPGSNDLQLRFNGLPKGSTDAAAEIDWIRVGYGSDGAYAAPTFSEATTSATLSGVPRRTLSLRSPAFLRCTGYLPRHAVLHASLGLSGHGDGDVEVRIARDAVPAKSLGTFHVRGADDATWLPVDVPLPDDVTDQLGALELIVLRASAGTRVLLGEPRLSVPVEPAPAPHASARGVLLVVFGQLSPKLLSLYGGSNAMPELEALGRSGVVFETHRATTPWAAGALASMLTALSPRLHGATDDGARLATTPVTVADAAREAGVATAFFTANPTTSAPYGFDRGWQSFFVAYPGAPGGSAAVFDEAGKWITAHKGERYLVVVHARGGHAPWDVPVDDLKSIAPDGYTGPIDPLHAAETLAKARRVPPLLRFTDADRARAWALYGRALAGQDAALGRLMTALRDSGRDADTTVMVTGDCGLDEAAHVPFGDAEPLVDGSLSIPLVLRPAGGGAGIRSKTPTTSLDVGRTALLELGLVPPKAFGGDDLRDRTGEGDGRVLEATLGSKRLLRWTHLIWRGGDTKDELCDLEADATCAADVAALHPLALEAFRRESLLRDRIEKTRPEREPPRLDEAVRSALIAWGK